MPHRVIGMRERLLVSWTPCTQLSIGFGGGIGFLYLANTTRGHWISAVFLIVHGVFLAIGYSAVQTIMERKLGPRHPKRYETATKSVLLQLFRAEQGDPGLRERLRAWINPTSSTTRWKVLRIFVGFPLYIAAFAIGIERPAGLAAVSAGAVVVVTAAAREEKARREENGEPPEIVTGDWRGALNGNLRDVFRRGDRDA